MNNKKTLVFAIFSLVIASLGVYLGISVAKIMLYGTAMGIELISIGIIFLSLILTTQGLFTLFWMLYAWENPKEAEKHQSPRVLLAPRFSFTALVPARHEDKVIGDTIRAINAIQYPNFLKETIVLCRVDDTKTIEKTKEIIAELQNPGIRLETFDGYPINKPAALNMGLKIAKGDIVTIFDAEDQPHQHIYGVVNTTFLQQKADVIQSGVQLMNYRSKWFSALNCMEYYFWFKSGLAFFSKIGGTTPLGGNTVFFKRVLLEAVNGWDDACLTEDADIGFRLTAAGAKTYIIYDEKHATQEETPTDTIGFMKQRTRWNQGFLQILSKNSWATLPQMRQRVTALYILLSPEFQALLLLYTPIAAWLSFTQKFPILVSLLSFIPLFLLFLQIITLLVGLYEFTKAYNMKFSWKSALLIVIMFYPYQIVLMMASFRALYQHVVGTNTWEKTMHINAHRQTAIPAYLETKNI
jgi:glycosyltransferase XagB